MPARYQPHISLLCGILFLCQTLFAQVPGQASKWLFGSYVGIDFMNSPISQISASQINTGEGSACMADAAGNLLFYTDGVSVWNQLHQVMANGTGLLGNASSSQSALIARQPGNGSIYYIFTTPSLYYSVVDMSLAAGMGSVTIKNVPLDTLQSEKLAGTPHCSGEEVWIIAHSKSLPVFHSFLLTPQGMNTTPVISTAGSLPNYFQGCMKVSPNGKKIGLAGTTFQWDSGFEVFDFDNGSGVVSNALLLKFNIPAAAYGCEFSPDGTKFYGTSPYHSSSESLLYQWDLCAGSNAAILASEYTVAPSPRVLGLQLAVNGKIYGAAPSSTAFPGSSLAAIHVPNAPGIACSFSNQAIFAVTGNVLLGLPNFISGYLMPPVSPSPPFTYSTTPGSCNSVTFSPGILPQTNCSASSYPFSSVVWHFGDAASGPANVSNATQPVHVYSSPGTYSVTAVLFYGCRKDTVRQTVLVSGISPTVSVSGSTLVCAGQSLTFTASGADTYSWSNGSSNPTAVYTPTASGTITVVGTTTLYSCSASKAFSVTALPCTGMEQLAKEAGIKVYPNPFTAQLGIHLPSASEIFIYNQLGSIVHSGWMPGGNNELNLAHLNRGLYFARIRSAQGSTTLKLVKQD